MTSLKKFKLDIFQALDKISNNKHEYFESLEEDQVKAFSPLIIMRWLSSKNAIDIIFLNHFVNPYVFPLGKYKKLLFNLMCVSTKTNTRYSWIKREAKDSKFPKCLKALSDYLGYSIRQTKDVLQFYSNDDIIEICNDLGYQKDIMATIKKELKLRNV